MRGYKAFDKNLKCQGFQFEVGKTYEHKGDVQICNSGFHFCKLPLDVLEYKDLTGSRFAEIKAEESKTEGSKSVTAKITIEKELSLSDLIKSHVSIILDFCFKSDKKTDSKLNASSGDYSQNASSGHSSRNASSGHSSLNASSGHSSRNEMLGINSVSVDAGHGGRAKGKKGCWIVLSEWKDGIPVCVKAGQIGEGKLEEDVWYQLQNGEFMEVK